MAYFKLKYFLLITVASIFFSCGKACQTDTDKSAILDVMHLQEIAWNKHDLEGFMQGYWKSDSLKFYGKSGLTKGWQNTLDNYKKGYPTSAESGTLKFTIDDISPVDCNSYWVMGQYHLIRTVGDANGNFLIIFKKIDGAWKIVADMSS
ncbi:nuclear transport factor 2 family protein [Ichthyenterobacterium sp. W332]|uniref:Nuclear transport factor 2 family protein n=1 Tax=Microcosmobacter mediterraneus TaxID=3075607 RepID=A0ABU2YPN8_9FLAO|nr:nuclear transport factor 2 family protein [Ichthyenterobacterium sp. W332]MDT0559003.1 nuclear transport factor 2 family protein [Ichthyenterobacterium sp. W332]